MNQLKPHIINDGGVRSSMDAGTDDLVSRAIGSQLKSLYREVESEPVPDKFAKLLEELAKAEQSDTGKS